MKFWTVVIASVVAIAVAVPAIGYSASPSVAKKVLKGKRGPQGKRGPVGPQGPQGIQGPAGQDLDTIEAFTSKYATVTLCAAGGPDGCDEGTAVASCPGTIQEWTAISGGFTTGEGVNVHRSLRSTTSHEVAGVNTTDEAVNLSAQVTCVKIDGAFGNSN